MKNASFLIAIFAVLVISGALLIQKVGKVTANSYLAQINKAFNDISTYLENSAKTTSKPQSQAPLFKSDPIPKVTIKNLPQTTTKPPTRSVQNSTTQAATPKPMQKSCYRFTVPHLDGSSSNLCYSQSDYSQLRTLFSQYSSSKANYEFELRVAQMYEESKSDFFQQSADEAKNKAMEYKDKMGQISLQMYNIESKGW